MKKLLAPCIHMNGTGKQDLMGALENAYSKIGEAQDALRLCAPNGRDYYVIGDSAYYIARDEHRNRMLALEAVRIEIEAIVGGIESNVTEVEVDV